MPSNATVLIIHGVYLNQTDVEILRVRIAAELKRRGVTEADLPVWDGTWPPTGMLWRVESYPPAVTKAIELLGDQHLCRMLRDHYDPEWSSDWAFIPGTGGVLLVQMREGPPTANN